MDVQTEPLDLSVNKGKKRRKNSTSSLPSLSKKVKIDPTEEERAASAPPGSVENDDTIQIDDTILHYRAYEAMDRDRITAEWLYYSQENNEDKDISESEDEA